MTTCQSLKTLTLMVNFHLAHASHWFSCEENLIIVYTNLAAAGGGADAAGKGQSRGEKKSRKALAKHGLKPVPNVNRVTIKKAKGVCSGTITVC